MVGDELRTVLSLFQEQRDAAEKQHRAHEPAKLNVAELHVDAIADVDAREHGGERGGEHDFYSAFLVQRSSLFTASAQQLGVS